MQWFGGRESDNVEEGSGGGGGGRGLFFGGGIIGVIGLVIYLFTGINPAQLLNGGSGGGNQQQNTRVTSGPEGMQKKFARVILAGTEDVWGEIFNGMNRTYTKPTLHLFSESVNAEGCGFASSATGPFYCPADQKVYLDTSFFAEMQQRFHAPGEFAAAYVIGHEVGHHVQNLLGISKKMDEARQQLSQKQYNKLSVKLELQADFYAGVWAHYAAKNRTGIVINSADIDSALVAAHSIGDDRLQQQYQGHVEPDSFTHGTSKQRAYWFRKGFDTGDINQGNTFAANDLDGE
ncbi:MAG: neutral zinc metallopeptidase [Bacteroidota bacterium]